ncbi:MAG TPA: DNA alkylation repair protein [Cyclobacteriaceae bacterium]|nr:DNA alkylation repair protein [Cyclobacteriaceae bacterium]
MKKTSTREKISNPRSTTAAAFIGKMKAHQSDDELKKIQKYFKMEKGQYGEGDKFMGIRMGTLFKMAKESMDMETSEVEKLLESNIHEVRAGAVSIMNNQARNKKTPESHRKELFDLYLRRHDRINNWDLVDLGAVHVIGQYLFDKPRKILYKLALSKNMWERRTAIVSTGYFIKHNDVEDTFTIGELMVNDKEDLINKAVGGWIRHAGRGKHRPRLLSFLDKHAATMPRAALRYAVEHLSRNQKEYFMGLAGRK